MLGSFTLSINKNATETIIFLCPRDSPIWAPISIWNKARGERSSRRAEMQCVAGFKPRQPPSDHRSTPETARPSRQPAGRKNSEPPERQLHCPQWELCDTVPLWSPLSLPLSSHSEHAPNLFCIWYLSGVYLVSIWCHHVLVIDQLLQLGNKPIDVPLAGIPRVLIARSLLLSRRGCVGKESWIANRVRQLYCIFLKFSHHLYSSHNTIRYCILKRQFYFIILIIILV